MAFAAALVSGCGKMSMVASQPGPAIPSSPNSVTASVAQQPSLQASPNQSMGDTWTGIHAFQVFDYGISYSQAQNDAHRYNVVWGPGKVSAWKNGNPNIIAAWYAPFDGDFTTHHDLTWWKANHPDWVLYRCNKTQLASLDGLKNIPLDISNPAVVKWQLSTYVPGVQSQGFNALAMDLVGLNNSTYGCGVWVKGVWHQKFTGQQVDPTWTAAVIGWHVYAYKWLHALSNPMKLGVNHVPESRPWNDPSELALINAYDFVDDERSFTNYGNSYASTQEVSLTLQWMKYIQNLGKWWIDDDKWNTQGISHQQFGWALGTYLLGKDHYASVWIDHLPGYGYEYWYSYYNAGIGHPCADAYADPKHAGVYYRKYTNAFVVVNTSASGGYKITLPYSSYTSIYGGTVTSPVSVGPDNAEILLTNQNGCL